ncbi:NADP-dependent 3-hydroxy acid dehydrogenase YdfG [Labedella gwakjiensis]|uniref:NADP-dependent 3-hydroxy acid dehydrogenase YdfG n=1 Tax=Labedella gwakjiensis TaxID=390269 RepID=A0A2P8GX78_9MICO|nr:SDR family NAD(P)-dependent oxidoreductase [Labedella gwakjiensis]PSL38576.1 NADP-dependent 3-hydroxy acid dehydrogenase YdfG [Labedella gwakjiensis]RUQ86918.1 SDR family NAD(P)-dependent oxidoreductase [Labedella gwakjiensis]
MTYPTDRPATWFVTGTSRGLGRSLVIELLTRGHRVAATTRSTDRLLRALDGVDTTNLLPLEVQLTDEAAVSRAIDDTVERFGGIDVVVNNAGYGYLAAVEETTDADVRAMFDVQVNGTWNVLRAVLPTMRAARSGHVINVSSILGLLSFPGWGLYCAAKYAVEGLTESLAAEVADHGIAATIVEPGYFDTDFLTSESLALPSTTTDAYPGIRDMVEAHLAMPGTQPGDPRRAAAAIIAIAEKGDGPLRQQLGSDSSQLASSKVEALAADIEAGHELAVSTDYSS